MARGPVMRHKCWEDEDLDYILVSSDSCGWGRCTVTAGFVLHYRRWEANRTNRITNRIGLSPTTEKAFYNSSISPAEAYRKGAGSIALGTFSSKDNPKSMEKEAESISGSEMQFMKQPMK